MSLQLWMVYASAIFFLCLTPGPNSVLAITNGMQYGVKKTFFSTLGCVSGLALLIAVSLSGLGLILAASETVFTVIKWLGAGYLIYLGVVLIRSKSRLVGAGERGRQTGARSNRYLFFQGFLIITTNPKVLIFLTAFLPQFYVVEASFWLQFIVLSGTFVLVEFVVEMLLAGFSSKLGGLGKSGRSQSVFTKVTGGVFVLAGAYLLTMEKPR